MLIVIIVTVACFALYWYSGGPDFGARYWYLILIPCVVLTIRGLQFLQEKFDSSLNGLKNSTAYLAVAVLILSLFSLFNYVPWRALDKYRHYLLMQPDIQRLAEMNHFDQSLVLIRGQAFPDFASAAVYNPLEWDADQPIFAFDKDAKTESALLSQPFLTAQSG